MKRSPTAAFWLSLIPGLGHIYIGQTQKGFLFVLLAVSAIHLAHASDGAFGIFIPFVWLFAMLDAHRSASETNRALESGAPPPQSWNAPISAWWGWVLIVLGVAFTLDNFDIIRIEWIWDFWPVGLILLGAYILRNKRMPEAPSPTPPPPPEEEPGIDREAHE